MKFICNLLLLFLLLQVFYTSSVGAANAINCRQQETVKRVTRQTAQLTPQQQYQQRQRNLHEQRSSQTSSVVKPVVRFFVATPGQQMQQLQVNSGTEQRIAFTSQQRQHHAAIKAVVVKQQQQQHYRQSYGSQQQQQQSSLLSSSSLTQSANSQQYLQSNSYMQRQQQQKPQQAYNNINFLRISQQPQQQQQQFQTQPPQQFHQSQQQPLQFYKPQIKTITNHIFQDNISNQQATSYPPQPPTQPQLESTLIPNQRNGAVAPVLSPLLPSYLNEDDKLNYTRSCDMCCIPGQSPCQHCCDTNPLLSATVLKSSAG
ncbi:probable basic-leucine zipper transcription factor Q [Bactrocera oleae]|uniref:probable basic-leucine zipper transcription factor Q n=1 Tax=Bactrocera oleae TaxID=104688 RepID=UPI00387E808F